MNKPVILTGIRSNDEPTLGNYLGAFKPIIDMQRAHAGKYSVHMFVPDLHSFTTPIDHGSLYNNTIKNLIYFVAAGLNLQQPDTYIYRQSYVPAHSELTWILDCFTYYGELQRMTQFKEKSEREKDETTTAALFTYPVLMAADILLYDAKYVPVGEDQRQHLELTRDIAIRFNNKFSDAHGELFVVPEDWNKQLAFSGRDNGLRIRSLRNPEKKMSKSVIDPAGTILLSDNPDEAAKKVMSATTDSLGSINYDYEKQPGMSNLMTIYSLLSGKPIRDINAEWRGNTQYGEFKSTVAASVKEFLVQFQTTVATISTEDIIAKLETDEATMRTISNAKLLAVQRAVGLRS